MLQRTPLPPSPSPTRRSSVLISCFTLVRFKYETFTHGTNTHDLLIKMFFERNLLCSRRSACITKCNNSTATWIINNTILRQIYYIITIICFIKTPFPRFVCNIRVRRGAWRMSSRSRFRAALTIVPTATLNIVQFTYVSKLSADFPQEYE